jgi:hypothetical protein
MWRIGFFLVLTVAVASGQAIVGDGPASAVNDGGPSHIGGGPVTAVLGAATPTTTVAPTTTLPTSTTTTTTIIVPAAGAADVNCPGAVPTQNNQTTSANQLSSAITCATPARTLTVTAVSVWAVTGTAGAKMKCSVYQFPAGYVSGTTAIPKVAAGCDTVEYVFAGATTNAFVTLATTGTCTLAPSTRYLISCNQDATAYFLGFNSAACTVGGVQCDQYTAAPYATNPLPDPWTAQNQATGAFAIYLTAH